MVENLKVVVVGDGGVGKSSFLITWSTNAFPSEYVPTVFDNYAHTYMYDGRPVNLLLWDTAGQEDYDRLRPLSYPLTDVFLICYDISRTASFTNVRQKWIPEVQHYCPDTPMVLIGLKSDLRGRNTDGVTYDDGAQLSREFGCASFYEVSSLNFHGITEAMRGTVGAGLTPLGSRKNKRRFNLFRKKKNKSSVQNDDQPHIPPPPVMPKNTVAPWIDIETSSLSTDWSKLINQQQLSDVVFHLGSKLYHSHRYVLSCSSDVMRQIFGIRQKIKCESLSQCVEWDSKRLKELTTEKVNEGLVKGFLSVVTENQSETTIVHITLDSECFTDLSFKYCLEFLYTGYINVTKDSEGIHDIVKAAVLLNLPELQMICENALKGDEELNPSIGTWLNDRNSNVAKELYFNKPFMSDVQFLIEGQVVHAHKIVLASRCDVLGAMLMGGFAESNTHQIELPGLSVEPFIAMMEYLYTDHCPIEETDSVSLLMLANQYVLRRLMSLCELYITKAVDKACAKSIADADINIIDLLLVSQLHNANQLSGWCLHFISSNYLVFEQKEEFAKLSPDNRDYVEEHRWPPVSYLEAMDEYQKKYGGEDDSDYLEGASNRRKHREKCSVM